MGKIDKIQKAYFKDKRRFADLWNGLVFQGKQIVNGHSLEECDSVQLLSNENVERTADVIMKRTSEGQELAILIQENQE